MIKSTALMIIWLAIGILSFSTSAFAESCTREVRSKKLPIREAVIPRGDGITGARVHSISIELVQTRYENCTQETFYFADYIQYNEWQAGKRAVFRPLGGLNINFTMSGHLILEKGGNINWASNFCGPYNTPGLALKTSGKIENMYFDRIDDFTLTPVPISGRIAPC